MSFVRIAAFLLVKGGYELYFKGFLTTRWAPDN